MLCAFAVSALLQIQPLDKAVESGAKDDKPVLVWVHKAAWPGEEEGGKTVRQAIGDLASRLVLAHVDAETDAGAAKAYNFRDANAGLVLLDPHEAEPRNRVLACCSRADEGATVKETQARVAKALETWGERAACRAAVRATWDALVKNDVKAFKASLSPWQVRIAEEGSVATWFKQGRAMIATYDTLAWTRVEEGTATEMMKKGDAKFEAVFNVAFRMIAKDGGQNGKVFKVLRSNKACAVMWP